MVQRPFELVLFGATGFTGQLVAEYLARHQRGLRWAIAGRSRDKLARLRERLSAIDAALSELPLRTADSADPAALRDLAEEATAIVSTAGPFARYGSELVAACVERGAHYCDITGETQWIRRMIAQHHGAAARAGVRIVHSAGYDSIPSDLGTYVLQQHARELHGMPSEEVNALAIIRMPHAKGVGLSGGTMASIVHLIEEARTDPEVRRVLFDPYALVPEARRRGGMFRGEQRGPGYEARAGLFTGPFLMAAANVRIVYRTNALLDFAYGDEFRYREAMSTGKGAAGMARALGLSLAINAAELAGALAPTGLLRRALPQPGEGASEQERAGASFAHELYGTVGGKHLRARVASDGDPGYGETAKMVAETALCLAQDRDELSSPGGVLTPAAALGESLVERLRTAGMTISAWTEA